MLKKTKKVKKGSHKFKAKSRVKTFIKSEAQPNSYKCSWTKPYGQV